MERLRDLPKVKSQLLRGEARTLVHKDIHPRAAEQGTLSLQEGQALAGGWLGRGHADQEAGVTHRKPSREWTDAEYWFKNSRTSFNGQWSERQGSTNCGPKGTSSTGAAQTQARLGASGQWAGQLTFSTRSTNRSLTSLLWVSLAATFTSPRDRFCGAGSLGVLPSAPQAPLQIYPPPSINSPMFRSWLPQHRWAEGTAAPPAGQPRA